MKKLITILTVAMLAVSAIAGGEDDIFRKPAKIEKGQKLPLIVFMHGAGGSPQYLDSYFKQLVESWNLCIFLPAGGHKGKVGDDGNHIFNWRREDSAMVIGKIRKLIKENEIDPTLVFVCGISAGGAMSYLIGLDEPEMCAGIISFGGTFPKEYIDSDKAKAAAGRLAVYIAHGRDDSTIPMTDIEEARDFFNERGIPAKIEICDCGHEFPPDWMDVLKRAMEWCNSRSQAETGEGGQK